MKTPPCILILLLTLAACTPGGEPGTELGSAVPGVATHRDLGPGLGLTEHARELRAEDRDRGSIERWLAERGSDSVSPEQPG